MGVGTEFWLLVVASGDEMVGACIVEMPPNSDEVGALVKMTQLGLTPTGFGDVSVERVPFCNRPDLVGRMLTLDEIEAMYNTACAGGTQ